MHACMACWWPVRLILPLEIPANDVSRSWSKRHFTSLKHETAAQCCVAEVLVSCSMLARGRRAPSLRLLGRRHPHRSSHPPQSRRCCRHRPAGRSRSGRCRPCFRHGEASRPLIQLNNGMAVTARRFARPLAAPAERFGPADDGMSRRAGIRQVKR